MHDHRPPRLPLGRAVRERAAAAGPVLSLVAASYAFRLPALLNAKSTNSDAAVVGLQAMHILRGEHAVFLWGSGYQTAADAYVAAAFFAALGPSPLALMLSSLTLHVLATLLVFATLRRHAPPWTAALLTLPLVLSPSSVHTYALYPPRQAALTMALAAFWAIDGAGARAEDSEPRKRAWLFGGGLLATLAVAADPYPMLLLPLTALFALAVARASAPPRAFALRAGAALLGAVLGAVPFVWIRALAGARSGPLGLTTDGIARHARLLFEECLPWALSYKVYFARNVMDYQPWAAPLPVRVLQLGGAASVAGVVIAALVLAARRRLVEDGALRLGLVGALTFPLALGAFLLSVMAMDHFSMRYLVVLTLMLPFAALPVARALGARRFALLFSPHLAAAAIGGWVGYGPFVHGLSPARAPELADDFTLRDALRAEGVDRAVADYWTAYRLTLLYGEEIVVAPTNAGEDRYPPYRGQIAQARRFGYVFDPGRSRESLEEVERGLRAASASVERGAAGRLTYFVVTR